MAAPISANPAFNKFNSLDRRALTKRQNGVGSNGLLKLATPTSGPESLPVRPLINQFNKEQQPERRHSSYDPAANGKSTRVSCRTASANGSSNGGVTANGSAVQQQTASAININGLPDPFSNRMSGSVYSSQESLHRGGSGTPMRPNSSTGNNHAVLLFLHFLQLTFVFSEDKMIC